MNVSSLVALLMMACFQATFAFRTPLITTRLISTALSAKKTYKVTVQHDGKDTVIDVREDTSILSAALDAGIDLPHDCDLGVCLTCPSKIVSGDVDQTGGTLDDSVIAQVPQTSPSFMNTRS